MRRHFVTSLGGSTCFAPSAIEDSLTRSAPRRKIREIDLSLVYLAFHTGFVSVTSVVGQ
jgi:hypothetical protein